MGKAPDNTMTMCDNTSRKAEIRRCDIDQPKEKNQAEKGGGHFGDHPAASHPRVQHRPFSACIQPAPLESGCDVMHRGYIKLWRKILDSGMLQNHKLLTFWVWCLLKATHKQRKVIVDFKEVELGPGQFIFGRKTAAAELSMSQQSVRTCLKTLKKMGNLSTQATNRYTVITICNWERYQSTENGANQPDSQPFNQQVTSKQPASNQQVTTNKNVKNEKNVKKRHIVDFDAAWKLYPDKSGKPKAKEAYITARKEGATAVEIAEGLERYKAYVAEKRKGGFTDLKYQNGSTWFRQRGWESEYILSDAKTLKPPETDFTILAYAKEYKRLKSRSPLFDADISRFFKKVRDNCGSGGVDRVKAAGKGEQGGGHHG